MSSLNNQDWLAKVQAGVEELTSIYRGKWRLDPIVFGTIVTEEQLSACERALGIQLPDDYREFLKHIGNGGFGPGHGLRYFHLSEPERIVNRASLKDLNETHQENAPIEIKYAPSRRVIASRVSAPFPYVDFTYDEEDSEDAEHGFLELAYFGMGAHEVLVVSGAEYGNVWAMDAEGVTPYEKSNRATEGLSWEPLRSHRYTFKDWYLDWLQAMLNTARQRGIL